MFEVIYLTGAPAAGKSSITRALRSAYSPLEVFEYGAELTCYINAKSGESIAQSEVRSKSSRIVTPEDVVAVDKLLVAYVSEGRKRTNIIIDTHAVTKESYGFRVTPYSLDVFANRLAPTQIWMIYTNPDTTVRRIAVDPSGRPQISREEAVFHTQLQSAVAITYGMRLGIPVYFVDNDRPFDTVVAELTRRLDKARHAGMPQSVVNEKK